MANGREKFRKGNTSRAPGRFMAIPISVVDCPAYLGLSMHARALLLEMTRQHMGSNNGSLLLSGAYMAKRGWTSNDMLTKCKVELLASGFIHQTVQGHRPNKASWFAVTWYRLDKLHGYDEGMTQLFKLNAYMESMPLKIKPTREELFERHRNAGKNGTGLTPPHGVEKPAIAPPHGVEATPATPPYGPMKPLLEHPPTPPHGDHLEMPSPVVPKAAASAVVIPLPSSAISSDPTHESASIAEADYPIHIL